MKKFTVLSVLNNLALLLVVAMFFASLVACSDLSDDDDSLDAKVSTELLANDNTKNSNTSTYLKLYDIAPVNSDDARSVSEGSLSEETLIGKVPLKNGQCYIPNYNLKRDGYAFLGFVSNSTVAQNVTRSDTKTSNIEFYNAGSIYIHRDRASDGTLYAAWKPITLTVNGEQLKDIDDFAYESGEYTFGGEVTKELFKALLKKTYSATGSVKLDFSKTTGEDFLMDDPVENAQKVTKITMAGVDRNKNNDSNSKLVSVILPGNLKNLPTLAFYNCTALTKVVANGVKVIGSGAFNGATSLSTLDIQNVQELVGSPFTNSGLKKLVLPATLKKFTTGEITSFFSNSNIESFEVAGDNPLIKSLDGVLFTKDGAKLVAFPPKKTGDYTIPAGTKALSPYVFAQSIATSVTVSKDVAVGNGFGSGAYIYTGTIVQ